MNNVWTQLREISGHWQFSATGKLREIKGKGAELTISSQHS